MVDIQWTYSSEMLSVCCINESLQSEASGENEEISFHGFTSTMKMQLENCLDVTADSVWRERRKRVFQEARKVEVESLLECKWKEFVLEPRKIVDWKCVSILVSCFCDTLVINDMSADQYEVAKRRPCLKCIVTEDFMISSQMVVVRSWRDIRMVRRNILNISQKMKEIGDESEIAEEEKREF